MKNLVTCLLILATLFLSAQVDRPTDPWRSAPLPNLEPFYHGVASGDPQTDRVVIWTRITTNDPSVTVNWKVATDTNMTQVVQQGTASTNASTDYTINVDVNGLQPYTFYYYEFEHNGRYSLRGRTRTLPQGAIDSLRFAVVSCSNVAHGLFNGYKILSTRNDFFAVLHLGDYIYEYADGEFGSARPLQPPTEILTLNDYRQRHSHYKLDEDLLRLHQQYPFIAIWDDHEVANDGWFGGAQNHTQGAEGDWFDRKYAGIRAYREWMPIRLPDINDSLRIYRRFDFGDLITMLMLDTRYHGREEQDGTNNNSPTRTILGQQQYNWLTSNLTTNTGHWQVLGQQVMMGRLGIAGIATLNADQWDGYPAERANLYNHVINNNVRNMVVLTGDIHTSWAMDLPHTGYQANGTNSAGVEYVVPSITSANSPIPLPLGLIQLANNHIKWGEFTKHGYMIFDVNRSRVQGDFYHLNTIDQSSTAQNRASSWVCLDGSRHLIQGSAAATPAPHNSGILAPLVPRHLVSTDEAASEPTIIGVYPNPFMHFVDVQYFVADNKPFVIELKDISGKVIFSNTYSNPSGGLWRDRIETPILPAGTYFLSILKDKEVKSLKVVKM